MSAERFEATSLLKAGAGISTYRGRDRHTGGEVVIKRADPEVLPLGVRLALEREGRLLARARTPVLYSGPDGPGWMLVMPFLDKPTLREVLADGPLSLEAGFRLAEGLLGDLVELHGLGLLHQDVKPENVVMGDPPRLIDFGLARALGEQSVRAGTPLYLAPEKSGALRYPVGSASDLYSAGVVLYEAWSGGPPHRGPDLAAVMRSLLTPLPALTQLPQAVNEWLARLTHPDPHQRYQRASYARAALQELRDGRGFRFQPEPGQLSEPAMIGREGQLERVEALLGAVAEGRLAPRLCVLAASGGGKSRFLEEIAHRAGRRGFRVIRVQGVEGGPSQGLQELGDLVNEVRREALADPELGRRLASGLGPWAEPVAVALPELRDVLGTSRSADPFEVTRVQGALRALVEAVARLDRPLALLVDDAQWVSPSTLALLRSLEGSLVGVAAFREEARPEVFGEVLHLPRLSRSETARLLESMAGSLPGEAVARVVQEAAGLPFLAAEMIRGLHESGALSATADGSWRFDPGRLQTSTRAAIKLGWRIETLETEQRRVLAVAALLGKVFEGDLLMAGCREQARVADTLAEAGRLSLIWSGRPGEFRFAHDRIREHFHDDLQPEERSAVHRRVADYLESHHPERRFELAHHLDKAGEPERAHSHAVQCGQEALERFALESAEEMFRIALRAPHCPREISVQMARCLELQGKLAEAAQHLRGLVGASATPLESAEMEFRLGRIEIRRGQLGEAAGFYQSALGRLGVTLPTGWRGILRTLVEFARARWGPPAPAPDQDKLLAATIAENLIDCVPHWDNPVPALFSACHTLAQLRSSSVPALGRAAASMSIICFQARLHGEGKYWRKQAERCLSPLASTERGQILGRLGGTYFYEGNLAEAAVRLREAHGLVEGRDSWELQAVTIHLALASYFLGEREDLMELGWRMLPREGDPLNEAASLVVMALGRWPVELPPERVKTQLSLSDGDKMRTLLCRLAVGLEHLSHGRWRQARDLLRSSFAVRHFLLGFYGDLPGIFLLTAERRLVEAGELSLRDALRTARAATPRLSRHALLRSHLNRELAWLAAARGHVARPRRFLELALAQARHLGLAGEVLQCDDMWARLERPHLPEAAAPPTLSQLDRYEGLLEAGRRLAEPSDEQEIVTVLTREAGRLLRPEAAVWLEPYEGGWREVGLWSPAGTRPTISNTLVEAAVESGQPVRESAAAASESLVLAEVRSGLAIPAGQRGVLYLQHRGVEGLFAGEEERLARFLIGLGQTALEVAERHRAARAASLRLREDERLFRSFFESAACGLALTDAGGLLLEVNSALARMLAVPAASLPGTSLQGHLYHADRAGDRAVVKAARRGRRVSTARFLPGGRLAWFQLTTSPLADEQFIRTVADVSHDRAAELIVFLEQQRHALAVELHDGMSQVLAAINLQARRHAPDLAVLPLLEHLGSLIGRLRAPGLEDQGLAESLQLLAVYHQRPVQVRVEGELPPVPPVVGLTAYRLAQQALLAQPEEPTIRLRAERDWLQLGISPFSGQEPGGLSLRLAVSRGEGRMCGGELLVRLPIKWDQPEESPAGARPGPPPSGS